MRATGRQGWDLNSVTNDPKSDREKNRTIRVRQRAIGRELRRIYDDVVKEPVPDDFIDLLQKLDEQREGSEKKPEDS
jgi:Anti-sigma factor NepR